MVFFIAANCTWLTIINTSGCSIPLPNSLSHSSIAELPCSRIIWNKTSNVRIKIKYYIRDLDHRTFLQLKLTWALAGKFRFRAATCQTFAMRRMTYIMTTTATDDCLPNNDCFPSWENQPFWPHWQVVTSNEGHYRSIYWHIQLTVIIIPILWEISKI